jgi:CheY-like chemotaxis protein
MDKNRIILYVDDDADDRDIFAVALKDINPDVNIVMAENGAKALDYLNSALDSRTGLPCLMVLDINMPVLDGKETFHRIRKDQRLQNLPVIVFTSSQKPADRLLFNSFGVEMITKPSNFVYMNSIAKQMLGFCL